MYSKIQMGKTKGFSREAVSQQLGLSWRTVDRYWDMTVSEYELVSKSHYSSIMDKHKPVVLNWLESHPDISAAQVQDWLHENYDDVYASRTVRRFVLSLRKEYGIQKAVPAREYFCIPELPPGQQLQADFGQYWAIRQGKSRIKLYLVVFVLAHSRYKFVLWQSRPFTAVDFVRSLEACIEEFGGITHELVIDQDALMVVSENNGDIIHTHEFEHCKNRHGFSVWVCRKGDPESKGMVEAGVKFTKYNFAKNRYFHNLTNWAEDCRSWLKRTGNGKVHEETKKIPAEVFQMEKEHLKPVNAFLYHNSPTAMITTPVRKNNTISYKSSRYSVPIGTYTHCQTAYLLEADGFVEIYDEKENLIAKHRLAESPGELVRNSNHARDTSASVKQIMDEAKKALGNTPLGEEFLTDIYQKKGRYIRDQLRVVIKTANNYEPEIIHRALLACQDSKLDSANDLHDFADYIFKQNTLDEMKAPPLVEPVTDIRESYLSEIKVIQRQPESYMKLVEKGGDLNES